MSKADWVGSSGYQYETEEEYKRAIGYYVCMYCGGDLPKQWDQGVCNSCACNINKAFEYIK